MAFEVSKTSLKNEANPQIEIQENLTRSLQKLLLVLHSAGIIAVYTDTTVYLTAHMHPRHNTSNT